MVSISNSKLANHSWRECAYKMLEKSMLLSLRLQCDWLEMVRSEVLYDNLGTVELYDDRDEAKRKSIEL